MELSSRGTRILTLAAIIVGVCMVVSAIYHQNSQALSANQVTIQRADPTFRHVYGSEKAPVKMIEFSDFQCPYCAQLHPTMKRLIDESGGQISWEYRHLPLPNHPLARPAATILECVSRHVDEEAFWSFTNDIYANQSQLSEKYLHDKALSFQVTEEQLTTCAQSEEIASIIDSDINTAMVLGGNGTPFTVVLYPDNTYKTVSGANEYEQWVALTAAYAK